MSARVRLHRIESQPLTLHFSPGYGARAQKLGLLVEDAHRFLAGWLGVEARTTLSILRRESWLRLRRAPYGYPHSLPEKGTIFAPARYPPRLIVRLRSLYEAAPPALQQKLCPGGESLDEQIKSFYDLVGIHELGHLFIHHLQLALGSRWLTELVANLFATAFFIEERPDLARCWLAWADLQAAQSVSYRSLDDYENNYTVLDFSNAAYYQGRFNQVAYALWQAHGKAIAPTLVAHFSLRDASVRARWERVAPDFRWLPPAEGTEEL